MRPLLIPLVVYLSWVSDSMIESDVLVQSLQDMGVNFFTGVPDSILRRDHRRIDGTAGVYAGSARR